MSRFRFHNLTALLVVVASLTTMLRPAAADDNGSEEFRRLQNELRNRMDQGLADATEFLESKIAASPDSEDLQSLRHSLATRYADDRDYIAANDQFQKLLEYQAKHADEPKHQYGMGMTIGSIEKLALASGNTSALHAGFETAMAAMERLEPATPPRYLMITKLAVLKPKLLAESGKEEKAKQLVQEQVEALGENQSSQEQLMALIEMLQGLASGDRVNDPWRQDCIDTLDQAIQIAIEAFPKDLRVQTVYASVQLRMISRWKQDDPDATKTRIKTASEALAGSRSRGVQAVLRRMDLYKERIAAAKPVSSLVGKPAPEWDIDGWVNTLGMPQADTAGKVIVLDFWAMWCAPCIDTFPHLREWRKEFGTERFEIVGVTRYYNFQWNDFTKRASASKEKVTSAQERKSVAGFLDHHQLEHPVMVSPEDSEMGSEYGVRGIPHVVVIDAQGIVQLVVSGAGQPNADRIHAKIKELLSSETE